jgi:hypothetical protein
LSEDFKVVNICWRHAVEEGNLGGFREGTIKFKGFTLNVYCSGKIVAGYTISKMNGLPLIYMDIFKNDK